MAEQGRLLVGIEPQNAAEPGGGGKNAGRGGAEKAQARGRRDTEMTGDIYPKHDGRHEIPATDTADPIGMSHDGGEADSHGMNNGGFMHAIEFRIVDLNNR
jgi:hypothetical protein